MLERLASPFRFTATSVAAVAVVIYAALFTSVLVFDGLPRVPKNTRGLDLDNAYEALSVITSRPHPYMSHANDAVRAYILARNDEDTPRPTLVIYTDAGVATLA